MSLTVGTNSWCTVAEADSFLNDWYGASSWASLSNTVKEMLLVTAFWKIYGNSKYTIAKSETDENVKNAQIITAFYIYENNASIKKRLALQGQGVTEFEVSKFREEYGKGSWLPVEVEGLLEDFQALDVFGTFERELD
jgi:hypothetical protein